MTLPTTHLAAHSPTHPPTSHPWSPGSPGPPPAQAIKACHESVRTDNVRFETDLVREQERFKDEVAAYAKEAQSFVRLGPCAPQQVEEYAKYACCIF